MANREVINLLKYTPGEGHVKFTDGKVFVDTVYLNGGENLEDKWREITQEEYERLQKEKQNRKP